jgi:hypothetical protein
METMPRGGLLCFVASSIAMIGACGSQPAPCPSLAGNASAPSIPLGYDAYRAWDTWPNIRLGTRTYLLSTYDRAGGNESADASHYIRINGDRAVAVDLRGTGILYFARANQWHGSPWYYKVDGTDHVVTESATATPNAPPPNSTFTPASVFAPPLSLTWSTTHGADLLGAPIPFTTSLEIGYGRTRYGTGYFILELFPKGTPNIASWNETPLPGDVAALVNRAGDDIAPNDAGMTTLGSTLSLAAGTATTVFDATGPATIRAFSMTVAEADAAALGAARLRITWDGRATPSIDAPVSLFFGTGSLFNRMNREWLVKAFPVSVHFVGGKVVFATYFPMPFARAAHVEIVSPTSLSMSFAARTAPRADPLNWAGYLHATYVDHGTPTPGVDLTLLDTTQTEGGGDWCGSFIGTSFIFSDRAVLGTLEGDPRFFFDDSLSPQVQGTGTEEWAGGGNYWGGETTTLPLYGHPVGAHDAASALSAEDQIESAYRFLLADQMPFGKNARIELEHGGTNESTEHYRTVAYWYGLPGACLVHTDALHVGDDADERAHRRIAAGTSAVETVATSYEWGGPSSDTGRHTSGTIDMSFAIAPQNFGVMLRRKLDISLPDQQAEVFVAPDDGGVCTAFTSAGIWYTAGSNTCVYSDPGGELDPFLNVKETVDKRWHDDEFLIARALTDGHSRIRVRIVPKTPWSEFRYTAYSWALPPMP